MGSITNKIQKQNEAGVIITMTDGSIVVFVDVRVQLELYHLNDDNINQGDNEDD